MLYADFQGEQGCVLQLLAVQPESQLAILGDLLAGPMRGDAKVVKVRTFLRRHGSGAWSDAVPSSSDIHHTTATSCCAR